MIARGSIRPSALAGQWYPGHPAELAHAVARYLAPATPPRDLARVTGVLAPHAGYIYSGATAGLAWGAARARTPARIVLVGPAHRVPFRGIALGDFAAFALPTGEVPVDRAALAELEARGLGAFVPGAHDAEHCLEIELPFAHALFPGVPIVPLLVGHVGPNAVVAALEAAVGPEDLVVISSDLSHFLPYERARLRDLASLEAVLTLDADRLGGEDACGYCGLVAMTRFARHRHEVARLLDYRSSGDTAGDKDAVVGYGAIAFGPPA